MFSFEVVGEERLRSRSSCRGNHLGEPGQRLWKMRCLRCPGTQQRDGITADDIFCHLDKIRYSNTVIHCASAMKCQMHWQHPSSIYIIWFGPSCRLGEHETQRDILERALGIMEAAFGANSHKVHCMAQHGASGGFVFITGFLGGFLCMHVYGSWQGGRDHDGYDILWPVMTSYDLWLVMTRYCWFCSFNLLILRYDVVEAAVLSGDSPGVRQPGEPEPCLRRFGGRQGTGASSFFVRFSPLE